MKAKSNCAKPLILTAALSAMLVGALPVAAEVTAKPAAGSAAATDPMFQRLDTDRDGYVSRIEATRQPRFMDAFREGDDDHDQRLSPDEFVKARSNYDRQRASAYAADSLITTKVKAALLKDPLVSALSVSVETAYGEVLLSGFVNDPDQARRARNIAAHVGGVKEVHDLLIVKG